MRELNIFRFYELMLQRRVGLKTTVVMSSADPQLRGS